MKLFFEAKEKMNEGNGKFNPAQKSELLEIVKKAFAEGIVPVVGSNGYVGIPYSSDIQSAIKGQLEKINGRLSDGTPVGIIAHRNYLVFQKIGESVEEKLH